MVTKSGTLPLDQYVPFLINRWLSFVNPTICSALNSINNKTLLEDKEMHYKTLIALFPKMKYCPKINYIKKTKETQTEEDKAIGVLAYNMEISKREAAALLEGRSAN